MKNLVGMKFGRLLVLNREDSKSGRAQWLCRCDCGNTTIVSTNHLTCGQTISCGCALKGVNSIDITGTRFGRLVALNPTDKRLGNSVIWECKCDCGNICRVSSINLRNGNTKSCGCLSSEVHSESIDSAKKIRNEYCIDNTDVYRLTSAIQKNNTSGKKGVSYDSSVGLWKAYIHFKGKRYYLGGYKDKIMAISAREAAEKKLHGEFLFWYAKTYPEQWNKIKNRNKSPEN